MAAKNKYAGLVDVDSAAPEIYETPELTDDASTVQTGTLRTDSPTPSNDEGDERLDRQRIDQDYARRRFEPSLVNAKDVNFSDTIADRQSYRTRNRRRRRGRYDDDSDGSESDEETLNSKIARLKREAEEVRTQLARREEGEFKDSVEEQDELEGDTDGMEELDWLIRGLHPPSKGTAEKSEETFLRSLANGLSSTSTSEQPSLPKEHSTTSSTISAIAAFSDRLSALEAALGLTIIDPSTTTTTSSILPTINTLSTQITTLISALSPTTRSPTSTTPIQTLNLDALSTRIATLTKDADALTTSRKAALSCLTDLHESRLRLASTRTTRTDAPVRSNALQSASIEEDKIHTELFLSEQSSKISALYQVLPTITGLQPLLPVVLERLRSLSVIHAGAAEAREDLDEVVRRQGEMKKEVQRWRKAVEGVERQMEDMREGMKENVDVVGGMVRGVEERVKALGK